MNSHRPTPKRRRGRFVCAVILAALCLAAFAPAGANAAFGVETFDGMVGDGSGGAYTQAGGHPYNASAVIAFNTHADPGLFGLQVPDADPKTIDVELPPGLIGNPGAVPRCAQVEFFSFIPVRKNGTNCPVESQIGVADIEILEGFHATSAVWNLDPMPGSPATFGFQVSGIRIVAEARLRSGSDYGVTLRFPNINQGVQIINSTTTLWGVPWDSAHDRQRCSFPNAFTPTQECEGTPGERAEGPNSVSGAPVPFITNPTACTAPGAGLNTKLSANSWQNPAVTEYAGFESHLPPGYPLPKESWGAPQGPNGCNRVPFQVEASVEATSNQADSPTGLRVNLHMPQDGLRDPGGIATAHLKDAVVTLPEGMAVNPAAADGLGSCSQAQIGLASEQPASCPESSKIGSVEITTPLLDHQLEGSVYLASQGDNKFGSLLAVYIAVDDPETGVVVKLPGRVTADPRTGRLTASFEGQPQLPFEDLAVEFYGGPRAALVNPPSCGAHTAELTFTPWSGGAPVGAGSSFQISRGPNGKPCPSGGFEPKLAAGTVNPVAGSYSPLQLALSREDGTQLLGGMSVRMPEGLLGRLAGIPYCPDSALAGIPGAEGSGAAELASPACPAASRLGTVSVGAGAGSNPLYVHTGRAYLAGPYKGAPLSIAIVTPAVAGPFDLGNVVVRTALRVDPETAQITAVSDPLPTVVHGIPLNLRDVRVEIDRREFTLNPTSCDPMTFSGEASSPAGTRVAIGDRFQVAGCERLAFKPKLALKLSGKTNRSAHPALRATLTMPQGGANIQRAQVTLPKTEFLAQEHIRTICTRVQYAAKSCPKASVYGYAKAWSPLLDKPLEGPVYLRSSSNPLPDLVASLDGQIHIDLSGRIDTKNARIRNTFDLVPDAPVSKFVLTMQGGRKGLLVNNTELCKAKPRADVKFDGQNGKTADSSPLVKVDCGKKRKGKGSKK
ncbi:MAG TPA: hypothetical protein VFX85_10300 [Solirubrobacterales bacterium]|nr:hypothetical protein [Solirubrobacterales bacterium]